MRYDPRRTSRGHNLLHVMNPPGERDDTGVPSVTRRWVCVHGGGPLFSRWKPAANHVTRYNAKPPTYSRSLPFTSLTSILAGNTHLCITRASRVATCVAVISSHVVIEFRRTPESRYAASFTRRCHFSGCGKVNQPRLPAWWARETCKRKRRRVMELWYFFDDSGYQVKLYLIPEAFCARDFIQGLFVNDAFFLLNL